RLQRVHGGDRELDPRRRPLLPQVLHALLPRRRPTRVGAQPPVAVPSRHHPRRRRPHRRNADGRQRGEPRVAWRHRGAGRPRIPLRPVPVQVRVRPGRQRQGGDGVRRREAGPRRPGGGRQGRRPVAGAQPARQPARAPGAAGARGLRAASADGRHRPARLGHHLEEARGGSGGRGAVGRRTQGPGHSRNGEGAPVITHVAAASAGGFQTSVTVDVPSGTADGDLVLAWLSANDADTLTPPSGWAQSFRHQIGTGTAVWLYTRTAASEPASYTWEWNASHQHHVILSTWRGAAAVRDHGVASAEGVTSIDMPSLTAVADDMLVGLGFHWSGTAGTEPTFPATMDTLITQATISAAAQEPITADGPTTTHTVSSSGSGRMAAAAVLLEPEGEDPGPGPEPNGAARRASYEFFVDWDTDGGLALGDFEAGLDGWGRFPEPPAPPEPTPAGIRSVSSVESAAAGSFTCPAPAGAADGDVLVAVQSTDLGDDTDLTTPSGWSLLETVTGGTDSLHTKA